VVEALRLERCSPVPGSPPVFAGVISLRGQLVSILDLARLLALPEGELPDGEETESGFVLLLRRHGQEIGLKVDRIEEIREIRPEELSLLAEGKYVKGLASGTLMLLSVEAILAAVS